MASPKSAKPFEQAGFVPDPELPLPELPRPSARPTEALRIAAELGCSIRLTGQNELLLSHPLLDERVPVVHSTHRRDTSRALLSLLRQAKNKLTQRQMQEAIIKIPKKIETYPTPEEPAPMLAVAAPEPHPIIQPRIVKDPKLTDMPRVMVTVEFAGRSQRIRQDLGAFIEQLHYRQHTSDTEFKPFHACQHPMCKGCRDAMDGVDRLAEEASKLQSEVQRLKASEEELLQQAIDLQQRIDDFRAAEILTPAPQTAVERFEGLQKARVDDKVVARVEVLFPDNVWLKEGDSAETRSEKYDMMLRIFEDAIRKHWGEHGGSLTRIIDAIQQCIRKDGYTEKYQVGFKVLNFLRFREEILKQRRPNGERCMVGKLAWEYFVQACDRLRSA